MKLSVWGEFSIFYFDGCITATFQKDGGGVAFRQKFWNQCWEGCECGVHYKLEFLFRLTFIYKNSVPVHQKTHTAFVTKTEL